jgi:ribosomal protein S27E
MPKQCRVVISDTGEVGCDTGRPRYRVACLTCGIVIHEATTGPMQRLEQHLRDDDPLGARPLREGEEP